MISPSDLRTLVIKPVLESLGLYSLAAENLLVGTAAHESGLVHLAQITGPALGIYQTEPATHADLWDSFLRYRTPLGAKVWLWASRRDPGGVQYPLHSELVGNLFYATAVARLIYFRARPALPDADDIAGLARYWKEHYCKGCAGTVEQWVFHYERSLT